MSNYVTKETCNAIQTALKEDIKEVKDDIKLIKNNHLPHLSKDLTELKANLKFAKWALGFLVPAMITILIKIFIR